MPYSLDTTGLAPSNYVSVEDHLVSPQLLANYAYVLLNHGPFFGNNLQVIYTPKNGLGVVLSLGDDYQPIFELEGFGDTTGTKVWGAISLINPALLGSIKVSYQSLGGNWSFSNSTIFAYLNSNYFNAATQRIVLASNGPLRLPNNPNVDWPINSRQSVAIAQAQLPIIDLVVKYEYLDNETQAQVTVPGSLTNPLFVAVTNQRASQPISAAALPLPLNAAKENGGVLENMAQSLTVQREITGTSEDTRYTGIGPSTIMSALKGIFANLQDLSVAITANQEGNSPVIGNLSEDPYLGTGPASAISLLKGIYEKTKGSEQALNSQLTSIPDPLVSDLLSDIYGLLSGMTSGVTAIGDTTNPAYLRGTGTTPNSPTAPTLVALLKGIQDILLSSVGGSEIASYVANIGELSDDAYLQGVYYSSSTPTMIALLKGIQDILLSSAVSATSFTPAESYGNGYISAGQNAIAAYENSNRKFFQIQNTHETAVIYLNYSGLACDDYSGTYSGFKLFPGDTATYDARVPTGQINVASTTDGATYFIASDAVP